MAKVKSKKRKMNQDFKNEVPSEVSYRTASPKNGFNSFSEPAAQRARRTNLPAIE